MNTITKHLVPDSTFKRDSGTRFLAPVCFVISNGSNYFKIYVTSTECVAEKYMQDSITENFKVI